MTKTDKKRFIRIVCNVARDDLLKKVDRFPESWDGIELRQLIIDTFHAQGGIVRGYYVNDRARMLADRKRLKAYKNEVLVRNLV